MQLITVVDTGKLYCQGFNLISFFNIINCNSVNKLVQGSQASCDFCNFERYYNFTFALLWYLIAQLCVLILLK